LGFSDWDEAGLEAMQSKRQAGSQTDTTPADPRAVFAQRLPSQSWEQISLPDCPQNYAWAWFKPVTVPLGLILRIPDETYRDHPQLAAQWTMRRLLQAAGVEPASVSAWLLNGVSYPGMNGTSPYLDAPLPGPVAGVAPDLVAYVNGPPVINGMPGTIPPAMNGAPMMNVHPMVGVAPAIGFPPPVGVPMGVGVPMLVNGAPVFGVPPVFNGPVPMGLAPGPNVAPVGAARQAPSQPMDAATADIYERIEADWNSSQEIEKDLSRLRKQLVDILGRLKTLNRDLTGPERVHSNNQDKKDWQDARRLLRDASNRVWKYLKAHDIGDTSNAGKRVWFEEIYRKHIAPRHQFDGLLPAARAFESHRKTITTLHGDMSNAYSFASLDGERKAQQVLSRIQTKVREASNKKNFLGVVLDS
jgi:hypothetical protein